jgi:hypothetical protein
MLVVMLVGAVLVIMVMAMLSVRRWMRTRVHVPR